MISGVVNLLRQPTTNVTIMDDSGQSRMLEANLDTGFSGDLTLPKISIELLDLKPIDRAVSYRIGDGAMTLFNAYAATVRWHDRVRHISVLESEISPTVGVGLMWGSNLSIDFQPGGEVAITELPDC